MKTLASTLVLGTLVTFMAGCAATQDDATEASTANMTGLPPAPTATVTTKEIKASTPQCSVSIEWPVVTTANAQVNAAIAKVLEAPVLAAICEGVDDDVNVSQEGGFTVDINAAGLLSISFGEEYFTSDMSSIGHAWYAHTFDLATGKELRLNDILTPAALAKAEADCMAELDEFFCGGHFDADVIASERPRFSLRDDGLVILAKVPEELVIPWTNLPASSLEPGPVATWRAAAK